MTKRQMDLVILFLFIGLIITGAGAYRRLLTDHEYSSVMLLVDWHAMLSLPQLEDEPGPSTDITRPDLWELMQTLPGAHVCYGEETVGSLLNQGIIRRAAVVTGAPAFEVYSTKHEQDVYKGAQRHGYWIERSEKTDGKLIFQTPQLPEEDLMLLPVAWCQNVIDECRAAGYEPILRPSGSEFLGTDGIERTLDFCNDQNLMLFQGPQVLGYPNQLDQVVKNMTALQQFFGWVEFDEQDGGATLAAKRLPNVLRVHSIPPEEMVNYSSLTATQRLVRAVSERGIRCLYIRPFVRGDVLSVEPYRGCGHQYRYHLNETNKSYFSSISLSLERAGFDVMQDINYIGGPPCSPRPAPEWLKMVRPLLVLAVGAALTWLLALWFPTAPRWIWTVLLVASGFGAVVAVVTSTVLELALFAAALVFPLLGFWLALLLYNRLSARWAPKPGNPLRLLLALLCFVCASAVTVFGGLIIHSGMWDVDTMLKVNQFRGVTVALALPLLILAAYSWQAETLQSVYDPESRKLQGYWQRFLTLWQSPIRYGDIAFIVIALGAVAIVLLRSGNDSPLEVLSLETWFRQGLEQVFTVRPRTKELLGHPLLVVFFLSLPWRNRLSLLLVLAGMLGQVSILNTFCHLHTPLILTLERVGLGLILGLGNGVVWGCIVLILQWFYRLITSRLRLKEATN